MEVLELDVGCGAVAFSSMRGNNCAIGRGDPYGGFNVCHYTGADLGHVMMCRRELADYVGVDIDRLVIPRQTHSVNVAVIEDAIPSLGEIDALVTCRNDVALVVNTADCLPVVFNDNAHGVIGIAHCGWRGLYGGIIASTIEAMNGIGASVADIRAAIGPCICGACYEVDEAFAQRFVARFGEAVCSMNGRRPHIDLRAVALMELEVAGIGLDKIFVADICSKCDVRLFSARRMGVASGRIATVVKRL